MTQVQATSIKPMLKPRASKSRLIGGLALSAGGALFGAAFGAVFMAYLL
jgi:hypothetical protein